MKKRILSLALVLLLALALAAPACAADDGWKKVVLNDVDGYLTVTLSAAKVEETTVTLEESLYSDLPKHEEAAKIFTLQRGSKVSVKVNEKALDNLDDRYLYGRMDDAGVSDPKELVGKDSYVAGAYYKRLAENDYMCIALDYVRGRTVDERWDRSLRDIPAFYDADDTLCLLQADTRSEDGKWDRVEIKDSCITVTFSKARLEKDVPFFQVGSGLEGTIYEQVVYMALGCEVDIFFNADITELYEERLASYLEEYGVSSAQDLIGLNCTYDDVNLVKFSDSYSENGLPIYHYTYEHYTESDKDYGDYDQYDWKSMYKNPVDEAWLEPFGGSIPEFACTRIEYSAIGGNLADVVREFYFLIPETFSLNYNGFSDLDADSPYYNAVTWAAENGFADPYGATAFGVSDPCPRGEVVETLWRALGSPEPTNTVNPFVDVKETDSFYKAVLWAVENEITNGTDATHFSPNATVKRCDAMTFIWRAANKPASTAPNPFTDIPDGEYYTTAVLWAVENGITNGTSAATFSPNDHVTRAQMVTFLYRQLVEKLA